MNDSQFVCYEMPTFLTNGFDVCTRKKKCNKKKMRKNSVNMEV
jgi:hypothetical protein